jgi:hypothetical protein
MTVEETMSRGIKNYVRPLGYLGLALFATAQMIDVGQNIEESKRAVRNNKRAEYNQYKRDKRMREFQPGTANDPYIGMVQDMYDTRTNHHRM